MLCDGCNQEIDENYRIPRLCGRCRTIITLWHDSLSSSCGDEVSREDIVTFAEIVLKKLSLNKTDQTKP
jgi:hypothetical protein